MNLFTRRNFLKISALSACSLVISTGLSGCGDSSDDKDVKLSFNHGVASGDPLADKVIIWTRVTTTAKEVKVVYEVATDKSFTTIIHNGSVTTDATKDYTIKVDIQNLNAATKYYYRFSSNAVISSTGTTKTLAEGSIDKVKMAVFSCANYTNGHFNAYMEASNIQDLDVALHLGDYIYEYGMYQDDDFEAKIPAYATSNAVAIGRELPQNNNTELLTLNDYRRRYALYHTDSGLQSLHKAVPMIVVWDDHEIANDTYKGGAENHQADEGSFETRVDAALQAYFEWLPIRPIENKKEIYRSFEFGNLLSLNMLETRIFSRDKQLNYSDYFTADGNFLKDEFISAVANPDRTMLGNSQLQWLQGEFASSNATWQVLGQQVLMSRMNLPAEILTGISQLEYADETTKNTLLEQINTSLSELATLKMTLLQGGSITEEEQVRLDTTLAYNLDAWDGYFVERETILGTAKAYNKNLVVLAGDTHNSWASDLKDISGDSIGVEFATTSVSSPGMEEYLGLSTQEQALQLEGALSLLVDDLKYTNLNNRGFMEVVFTKEEVLSNWHYISSNDSKEYTKNNLRAKTLQCLEGMKKIEI